MADQKNPGGPPVKFKDEYVNMAFVACSEAPFTDAKLAKLFDVAKSTINRWKKEYPKFGEALKSGKDIFDTTKVEASFFKRCTGYSFTETTREPAIVKRHTDGEPTEILETRMTITKKVRKHVVPDGKSCMDWLCNRAPDRWKKVKHVEITGKGGGPVQTESLVALPSGPMTIEQWEEEVKAARVHDKDIEPGQVPGNA